MRTPAFGHPHQMSAEQLAFGAVVINGVHKDDIGVYESYLRSGPNGAKIDTEYGSLPLAQGQLIKTLIQHEDGGYGADAILRYVGEDNRFHDITYDQQGRLNLPEVVQKRLANLEIDIPAFTDPAPLPQKYLVKDRRDNAFFDPTLKPDRERVSLFKKVALGAAEIAMNAAVSIKTVFWGRPPTTQHEPRHLRRPRSHRPQFA